MEAANGHVDFTGWLGIRAKKRTGNGIEPCLSDNGEFPVFDGAKVLGISLQDLSIDEEGKTKLRLEKVVATHWDLVIFDEVHFGSRTERAKHIIDSLHSDFRLDLSGTPFRLIQEDDFAHNRSLPIAIWMSKKTSNWKVRMILRALNLIFTEKCLILIFQLSRLLRKILMSKERRF
jgi:hypothetical protein